MTHIALLSQTSKLEYLGPLLQAALPAAHCSVWPDPACLDAEVAVCWNTPPGLYEQMPRLRLVHSIAAGVDNILPGSSGTGLPVCRVVDEGLTRGMVEYVMWAVLHFHRGFDLALRQQRSHRWSRPPLRPAGECRVGIMGLGALGRSVAARLLAEGYRVGGWARGAHAIDGVATHAGPTGLQDFLASTDILVNLLPLTDDTRGILGQALFSRLPQGACVVGCGRGEHLVAEDLIAALQSGHLRGAVLDVFPQEPLDAASPLWDMPQIVVTPHMATMASPAAVVRQVAENIRRLQGGQPLLNLVDAARGY
ncbi:glyoxylate/hydroxypyruvate reductase A [Xylophilus rhododendri]|uniref:Glyoxylate/hydroxypyruvate reductase A n=1 Tax=Xylophilus rhododendri TaxID=2697032 RepID=A0A857J0G1_9BURK|nr:glyoxylate/hydroxypyruvate reductase A [Xylophilus rhododendri]QHI97216.1 glyoxylate/hydroxypyruvate reductase A [Xylophilus rhododendri]